MQQQTSPRRRHPRGDSLINPLRESSRQQTQEVFNWQPPPMWSRRLGVRSQGEKVEAARHSWRLVSRFTRFFFGQSNFEETRPPPSCPPLFSCPLGSRKMEIKRSVVARPPKMESDFDQRDHSHPSGRRPRRQPQTLRPYIVIGSN